MELVKITDLTGQLGISSRSLRYYEQVGLIQSERPEHEKYRFYGADSIERLKQIMVLRKMQIPIKDVIRIFKSQDMSAVVEAFVTRLRAIDNEMGALTELKRIINEFLQAMLKNGITKISALPLLYEEMDKQLATLKDHEPVTYERLSAVSEQLSRPVDIRIVALPAMRVLSSKRAEPGIPDAADFWDWLHEKGILPGRPGHHELFEYQDDREQTVFLQKIDDDFVNDGPFIDYAFDGGLFAACCVYADEDIGAFHKGMFKCLDDNPYYEADYRNGGRLRHETLAQTVLSPDDQRERLELFLPIKKRRPDISLYDPNERAEGLTPREIEEANPVLWQVDIPMDKLEPVFDPYYRVNENGEAEYIAYIDKRLLSTNVRVKIPFRVDIEFKVDEISGRFGYGSDEGSIRFYHGSDMFGINMENNADSRLSKEAISFHQPGFGDYCSYPKLGKINPNVYNNLTWIVGEKHFAVILNGDVRYCGVHFPYMTMDTRLLKPHPILLGSNGQGKRYFRAIRVSQLKHTYKSKIKEGALIMVTSQSNNMIPNIHQLITMHYGENYWFNGCAKYVMECLGEPDYDYWFFAGLTGDNLAQVFAYDRFRGDGASDYLAGQSGRFVEGVFDACGYASTFVNAKSIKSNRTMYLQTLISYIDKGIPVIRFHMGWGVFVGYEDYGKVLLYMTADKTEPERLPFEDVFVMHDGFYDEQAGDLGFGWLFVGEKKRQVELKQIYRDIIRNMPKLLTTKVDGYCFGPEAFRAWAAQIESGRFDNMKPEELDGWAMYKIYVCNLATNGSCNETFFKRAMELNPDLTFLNEISNLYRQTGHLWNDQNGEDLEAIGGGFNVTLAALQNREKRDKIVAKILEFADCMDKVLAILNENI